jgi:hypothetical protein
MTMVGNFLPSPQELHEISGDGAIFQELELLLWSCLAKKNLETELISWRGALPNTPNV